jgi:hypothetical protein
MQFLYRIGAFDVATIAVAPYITSMWKSRLRRPLHLSDGRSLRTLDDARAFIASLPERDSRHDKWQGLRSLLFSAAQSNNAAMVAIVTDRLAEALRSPPFTVARLDETEKWPPAPSVRHRANT